MTAPAVTEISNGVTFRVRVTPRARVTALAGEVDGVIHVRLAAPPVEGRANQALCAFLAELLGVRCAAVTISSGDRSRHKVVEVRGITRAIALRALAAEEKD